MQQDNTCLIDNLGLASFLVAKGLKLRNTEAAPNKRGIVAFRFDDPEHHSATLIAEYYTDGTVIAREFDAQLTRLKTLIWNHTHPEGKRQIYGRDTVITPNYFPGGAR